VPDTATSLCDHCYKFDRSCPHEGRGDGVRYCVEYQPIDFIAAEKAVDIIRQSNDQSAHALRNKVAVEAVKLAMMEYGN